MARVARIESAMSGQSAVSWISQRLCSNICGRYRVPAIEHGLPSGDNTCYKLRDFNASLPTESIKLVTRETMC